MEKRVLLFILALCFWVNFSSAQKTSSTINFTEVWVWEYVNIDGKKGKMAIYHEPKLNYWLITPDDAGFRDKDEMSLWFLIKPNGEVLQAYQDAEHSSKRIIKHQLPLYVKSKLPSNWKTSGKSQLFGDKQTGFSEMEANEYQIEYGKTSEKTTIYIAKTKSEAWVLSFFNDLLIEAKLPIQFPRDLPKNLSHLKKLPNLQEEDPFSIILSKFHIRNILLI